LWGELIVLGWGAMCVNELRPENDPAFLSEFPKQIAGEEPLKLHCRVYGGCGIDGMLLLHAGNHEYQASPVSRDDAKPLSEVVAESRSEAGTPIVIRLGDNTFKRMLRAAASSGRSSKTPGV
jgi:hypothetical protein